MKRFKMQVEVEVPEEFWEDGNDDTLYGQIGYGIVTAITACLPPAEPNPAMETALATEGMFFTVERATAKNMEYYWGDDDRYLPDHWDKDANKFIVHQAMPAEWGEGSATPIFKRNDGHGIDCWM